jgi:hypothetical protein
MIVAAIAVDVILPALTVSGGLAAAIFTALRFNRDDATAVVNQQKTLLDGMRDLNQELQEALDRCRANSRETAAELDAMKAERKLDRN